jgi:hypothetical protein
VTVAVSVTVTVDAEAVTVTVDAEAVTVIVDAEAVLVTVDAEAVTVIVDAEAVLVTVDAEAVLLLAVRGATWKEEQLIRYGATNSVVSELQQDHRADSRFCDGRLLRTPPALRLIVGILVPMPSARLICPWNQRVLCGNGKMSEGQGPEAVYQLREKHCALCQARSDELANE